jgi:hypothetical protein
MAGLPKGIKQLTGATYFRNTDYDPTRQINPLPEITTINEFMASFKDMALRVFIVIYDNMRQFEASTVYVLGVLQVNIFVEDVSQKHALQLDPPQVEKLFGNELGLAMLSNAYAEAFATSTLNGGEHGSN